MKRSILIKFAPNLALLRELESESDDALENAPPERVRALIPDALLTAPGLVLEDEPLIKIKGPARGGGDPFPNHPDEEAILAVRANIEDFALPELWRRLDESHEANTFRADDWENLHLFNGIGSANLAFDQHVGTYSDVKEAFQTLEDKDPELNGEGVYVAIVDSGINYEHLKTWTKSGAEWTPDDGPQYDTTLSYDFINRKKLTGETKGKHGTQMAFNVWLAAPQCTLIDLRIFEEGPPNWRGLLWEDTETKMEFALKAIFKLEDFLYDPPEGFKALVVTNSWGVRNPLVFFSSFVKDPAHLLTNNVARMAGGFSIVPTPVVDVLFAAGNCGEGYTAGGEIGCGAATGRQGPGEKGTIYGANSHDRVLSVGASTIHGQRLAYSSQGYGYLEDKKPDVCAPAHFLGPHEPVYQSRNWNMDRLHGGTSASCSVMAGVVAAIRSKYHDYNTLPPDELRQMIRDTASKPAHLPQPYDPDYGYGCLNITELLNRL